MINIEYGQAQCPPGDVTLSSQADVDNYVAMFPSCNTISGNLTINGADITDISGLNPIQTVTGDLSVQNNTTLPNLTGLNVNLNTVNGDVTISGNPLPTGLHLNNLNTIGGTLEVDNNADLVSLGGFNSLTALAGLKITNNPDLEFINALTSVTTISGNVEVSDCPTFQSLTGLTALSTLTGDLLIQNNAGLTGFNAFSSLTSIGGDLTIIGNSMLGGPGGLQNVTNVTGTVRLENTSFCCAGLPGLTTVGGNLELVNTSLTSISELENITTLSGSLTITGNTSLGHCAIESICNFAGLPAATISGNASGCTSVAEVQTACGPQTCTWTGCNGNWTDASKWSTPHTPRPQDNVVIDNSTGCGPDLVGNVTVASLTMSNETVVNGTGDLTVNGNVALDDISFGANAKLIVNNGTVDITSASPSQLSPSVSQIELNNCTVNQDAPFSVGGGQMDASTTWESNFALTVNGQFTNLGTYNLNIIGITVGMAGSQNFNNQGTFNQTTSSSLTLTPVMSMFGTWNVNGTLLIGSAFVGGTLNMANNASVTLNSGSLNTGLVINSTGNGKLVKSSNGTLNLNHAMQLGGIFRLVDGTIAGTGSLTVNSGGTFEFGGDGGANMNRPVTVDAGGTMEVSGMFFGHFMGADLTNNGTVNLTTFLTMNAGNVVNNGAWNLNSSGGVTGGSVGMFNSTTFDNFGTFTSSYDATITGVCGSTFTNESGGQVIKSGGAGDLTFDVEYVNEGELTINSGAVQLDCPFTLGGTVNGQPGSTVKVNEGSVSFAPGGPGSHAPMMAATIGANITLQKFGTGTFNVNDVLTINGKLEVLDGTIAGTGSISVPGEMDWDGGTINVPTTITSAGNLDIKTTAGKNLGAALTLNGSTSHTDGTLTVGTGGSVVNGNTYTFSGGGITLSNGAVFTNNSLFTTSLDAVLAGSCSEKFLNSATGTVTKSGGMGFLIFNAEFETLGTVNVNSGNIQFECLDFQGGSFATTVPFPPRSLFVSGGTIAAALDLGTSFLLEKNGAGTLSVNAPLSAAGVTFSQGTINGSSTLTLPAPMGTLSWTGGTLQVPTTVGNQLQAVGGGTKTLAAALTLGGDLTLSGGTLTESGGQALSIPNTMTWDGGSLDLPTTIESTGDLEISGNTTLLKTLTNDGAVILQGGDFQIEDAGSLVNNDLFDWVGGNMTLIYGGDVVNNGDFEVSTFAFLGGGTGEKFTNAANGTFIYDAMGPPFICSVEFENLGTVDFTSGLLNFAFLDWQGGTFNGSPGTTLMVEEGTVSAALTIPAGVTFSKITANNLTMSGPLTLNGTTDHTTGGMNTAAGGGITNGGTYNFSGGSMALAGGTSFTNSAGANFNWSFDTTITGPGATIDNDGTLTTSVGETFVIQPNVDNSGTMNLNGNTPSVNFNGSLIQSGTVNIGDDTALFVNMGGTVSSPFSFGNFSTLTFGGGTTDLNTAQAVPANAFVGLNTGSTLNGTGSLSLDGGFSFNGGTLNVPTTINAFGSIAMFIFGPPAVLTKQLTIAANGTANMIMGTLQVGTGGSIQNNGQFNWEDGTIDLAAGTTIDNVGTFSITGIPVPPPPAPPGPPFTGSLTGTGTINNSGIFENTLTNPPVGPPFAPALINTGTLRQTEDGTSMAFTGILENQSGGQVNGVGLMNFNGGFLNDGSVNPGNSPGILTVNTFENIGATLNMELGSSGNDHLIVNGAAQLGGNLVVSLFGGFTPTAGNTFTLISAAGGYGGTQFNPANITWPSNPADWSIQYSGNDVIIGFQAALPIELIDFQAFAKNDHVLLEWQTASETNNRGFEIQSAVGSSQLAVLEWETIGFVDGQGTTTARHEYFFTHENPRSGLNYYRLRQMDFDGHSAFSEIRSVDFRPAAKMEISPNPVSAVLQVKMEGAFAEGGQWQVLNTSGQVVLSGKWPGGAVHFLDLSGLAGGQYLLRFSSGGQTVTERVVKKS